MNTTTIVGLLVIGGSVAYLILKKPAQGGTIPVGELPDCGGDLLIQ